MQFVKIIAILSAVVLAYMFGTGQLRVEDGMLNYVPLPSHHEEFGHTGHEHGESHCMTAKLCASDIAIHAQEQTGSVYNGLELRSVRSEGVQVFYDYVMPLTKAEFESAIPPPDEYLKGNSDSYCADELNRPMIDHGVVVVMRFFGKDNSSLGEVRIDECLN